MYKTILHYPSIMSLDVPQRFPWQAREAMLNAEEDFRVGEAEKPADLRLKRDWDNGE